MVDLSQHTWQHDHQEFERDWWGDCVNTYAEENKQISWAKYMGLEVTDMGNPDRFPLIDLHGRSVIDIGGGPVSLLLKTVNGGSLAVMDPCSYPAWVYGRYEAHDILYIQSMAENMFVDQIKPQWDEAWIYNVLQHVLDPGAVMDTAFRVAKTVRVFEGLELGVSPGHPHNLMQDDMDKWCRGQGNMYVYHDGNFSQKMYSIVVTQD
jgi:hypothetical protein